MIITRFRCLIYDFDLKAEEKAITFAEFGPNKEFEKVFCFNKSFNMEKVDQAQLGESDDKIVRDLEASAKGEKSACRKGFANSTFKMLFTFKRL